MPVNSLVTGGPRYRHVAAAVAMACAVATAGCASTPAPSQELTTAAAAVERAERAGARQAAPGELTSARDKLVRAQALADSDGAAALRLAEQAEADAALAEARSEALRANNALATVNESLEALREEANRPAAPASARPPPMPPPTPPPPDGGFAVPRPLIAPR